jgi:dUTPase
MTSSTPIQTNYKLDIFVENSSLHELYDQAIEKHNRQITESFYPDSGFDVFTPCNEYRNAVDYIFNKDRRTSDVRSRYMVDTDNTSNNHVFTVPLDLGVKLAMSRVKHEYDLKPSACYLYARSSLSKYPFRLSNNQGIIDSGYRGSVKGMFDVYANMTLADNEKELNGNHYNNDKKKYLADYIDFIKKGTTEPVRLTQICAPNLEPFVVERVISADDLSSTSRGERGVGSTGQ